MQHLRHTLLSAVQYVCLHFVDRAHHSLEGVQSFRSKVQSITKAEMGCFYTSSKAQHEDQGLMWDIEDVLERLPLSCLLDGTPVNHRKEGYNC